MYHTNSQDSKMLSADELAKVIARGVTECRHLVFLAVQNSLPINEAPLFSWVLDGDEKTDIKTHSSREELCLFFLDLQEHLRSTEEKSPICGIIPLKREKQVGYFIFVAQTNQNICGLYQQSPIFSEDKALLFNNPLELDASEVVQELIFHNVYH